MERFGVVGTVGVIVMLLLAGCGGSDDGGTTPTTGTTGTGATSPGPNATAPPAPPGEAYKQSGTYSPSAAPSLPKMSVVTAWKTLSFTVYLNSTSACYVLQADPPAPAGTGSPARIAVKPPASAAFNIDLGAPSSCGTSPSGGPIGQPIRKSDVPAEAGDWTLTVTGRGQNVRIEVVVAGK